MSIIVLSSFRNIKDSNRFEGILTSFILVCKNIGFLILVFYLWGTPYERGFFCDDESLKHPYKESTVTNLMLYIVGIGLPVLSILNKSLTLPYEEEVFVVVCCCCEFACALILE
ncbi:unnamed protein product [Euphydryas editha]|uniref:Uncharacterized protein n=1 Tax=Euphydryas editha TaxID=104508 RepID=A0AAU9TRL4_EUPED|nr:unnamed protein product [Euphydryas editha]